jgi:hypothetical protein
MQLCRYFVSQSGEFCHHNPFVVSQRVYIVVVYFVIDSVRKLLDTPSYKRNVDILKELKLYGKKNMQWVCLLQYFNREDGGSKASETLVSNYQTTERNNPAHHAFYTG